MANNQKNNTTFSYTLLVLTVIYAVAAGIFNIFLSDKMDIIRASVLSLVTFVLLTLITVILYAFITSRRKPGHGAKIKNLDIGEALNYDLLNTMFFPIVLVDKDNKIVYCNPSFEENFVEKGNPTKHPLSDYCKEDIIKLAGEVDCDFIEYKYEDSTYRLRSYEIKTDSSVLYLGIWNDCSGLAKAQKQIEEEDVIVAFVNIDNLDELMQHAQELYRNASVQVEKILHDWADSVHSIFREYERDKFIMLFYAKYLDILITSKFDVLDRIRNIRVGEGNLPITVSMGISHIDGSLSEKEKSSRSALETALQRGGDQVVLKNNGEVSYFGGKVQSTQKRTRVKARVTADALEGLIKQSGNVLIMAHSFPDFDAIGASVGMARIVSYFGKSVNIVTDIESKNAQRCYELLEDIDLYKSGRILVDVSQAQELLEANTLLIAVDVNNRKQAEAQELVEQAHNIAVIDHHRKTSDFHTEPSITYIDPTMSSACEMVAEMAEHLLPEETLSHEEADIMLAGIMLDTKNFTKNTGARTFAAAMYLRNQGANPLRSAELFKTNLDDISNEADFERNVTIYRKVIAISKNSEDSSLSQQSRISAAKAADKLLNVEGIKASFVMCVFDDRIHISARSDGTVNVQLIAEKLGGGGHFDAAATLLLYSDTKKAMAELKAAVDEYFEETKETQK